MKVKTALLWLCGVSLTATAAALAANDSHNRAPAMTSIRVQIGEKVFTARLEDTETARAFAAMLPLKLSI